MRLVKFNEFIINKINDKLILVYLNKIVGEMSIKINDKKVILNMSLNNDYLKYQSIYFKMIAFYLFNNKIEVISFNNTIITKDVFFYLRKYKYLLFDIDDTILSFAKAERNSLTKALKDVNYIADENTLKLYHKINMKYWEMVERNEITKDECLIKRFEEFLPLININYDPIKFEDLYRKYLNNSAYVIKNARRVLIELSKDYKIYAITNGVKKTQQFRMKKAKMDKYFLKSFISEDIGYNKPSKEFYEVVENYLNKTYINFNKKECLVIGDSLTSDIKLAIDNGLDSCYFNNSFNKINKLGATYTINYIDELLLVK